MNIKPLVVSRIISGWISSLTLLIIIYASPSTGSFYSFGPNSTFVILGFHVDTGGKYVLLVFYSIVNTCLRSLRVNILQPWITLVIQDETKSLKDVNKRNAYEISLLTNIYGWFDWLISISMLLAQVDMIIIEITCDIISVWWITKYYLSIAERQSGHTLLNSEDIEINGM